MKLISLFSVVTDQPTWMFDWGNIFNNQFFLAYNLAQAILVLYGLSLFLLFFYIILPLGLSVFSVNLGILFWSFFIMLSYGFYAYGNTILGYSLIGIEYLMVILFLIFPDNYFLRKCKSFLKLNSPQ